MKFSIFHLFILSILSVSLANVSAAQVLNSSCKGENGQEGTWVKGKKGSGFPALTYCDTSIAPPSAPQNTDNQAMSCEERCVKTYASSADRASKCVEDCKALVGPPAPNESPSSSSGQCMAEFQELLNKCETSKSEATNSCDSTKDQGMNGVSSTASQIALVLGQATSASTHLACSKMAALSQAANAAVLAFQGTCQSSIGSCVSACSEAQNYIKQNQAACFPGTNTAAIEEQVKAYVAQTSTPISLCKGLDAKVQQAQMAMNNIQQTAAASTACAQETAAVPDLCISNPNLAGCKNGIVDCSSPSMANDKVCICTKNPSDPACVTAKGSNSPYGGSQDFSSRLNSNSTSISGDDIPGLDPIAQGSKSGGGGRGVDGKVGGGAGIAGGEGGGGSMGGGSGGGGGPDDPTAVTSGFYGAGGGMGGGVGGGAGGGAAGGRYGVQAGANRAAGGPDLRAFLPGGKYDPRQRGLAGATGVDGITGPHTNIWKKIQNRYQATSPTLLP